MNEQTAEDRIRDTETLTTLAPVGADLEEVRRGVREAQEARAAAFAAAEEKEKENNNHDNNNTRLPSWSSPPIASSVSRRYKSSRKKIDRPHIEPYPGT